MVSYETIDLWGYTDGKETPQRMFNQALNPTNPSDGRRLQR
jgi:hypothetical protein